MSIYWFLTLISKDLTRFIINVIRFKIRCSLEIKFTGNLKYLSLLELNGTKLFINGLIDIFILKNETEGISLNFPRYFTQKIGDKYIENISRYHLKRERIQTCSIFWYMTTSLCSEFSFSFSSDRATMYNTRARTIMLQIWALVSRFIVACDFLIFGDICRLFVNAINLHIKERASKRNFDWLFCWMSINQKSGR